MKVNLIDIDKTGFPNLALMKLSTYYKNHSHEVYLNGLRGDINHISCVFPKNKNHAERIADMFEPAVNLGGSGININTQLPPEIEHLCPDYDLYPGLDYSLGFTSRGCIRHCEFCIVPEKEGYIKEHSPLIEFVKHKKVRLLDNNFFASPKSKEKLIEMIDRKLIVDFNQGLDIRLMTPEFAELLVKLNPPFLRFSWDNSNDEYSFNLGINYLKLAGFPICRKRVRCYVLAGFNSSFNDALSRCEQLHNMDIATFVQVYKGDHPFSNINKDNIKDFRRLTRWANRTEIWTKCDFEDYKR